MQIEDDNTCIWCGGRRMYKRSEYCRRGCYYEHQKHLALTGELKPKEILVCPVCKEEFPFFTVLNNRGTCSSTSGKDCAKVLKNQQTRERNARRRSGNQKGHRLEIKGCHGDCVDFLGRCLLRPHPFDGCYRKRKPKPDFSTRNIMAYV